MYSRRSSETLDALEALRELEAIQDDPCVGPFWYDPNENELFGVWSSISTGLRFVYNYGLNAYIRTGGMTHKRAWEKQVSRGEDHRCKGTHDSFPRGYVLEVEDVGFKVYTGDWIEEYPGTKRSIMEEFQLPEDNTEFIKADHFFGL